MRFDPLPTNDDDANPAPRPRYSPANLLDRIEQLLNLNGDAELASVLNVAPPALVHIRQCVAPVRASMIQRMAEVTGLSTLELRHVLGDRRHEFRC